MSEDTQMRIFAWVLGGLLVMLVISCAALIFCMFMATFVDPGGGP